jgi:hypothetical protein
MQHLLAESEVSPEELVKLKQLIAEHEAKEAGRGRKGTQS